MLLGTGSADLHSLVLSADTIGIRGSFAQAAFPKTMAPYKSGHLYFHGGVSLVEAIVPVLIVQLSAPQGGGLEQFQIELSYKKGAKRITTRLPAIEIFLAPNLFAQESTCEILLEAQDSKGNVVGEPRPSGDVNPATRTITLLPNETKQIILRMDPSFEGNFTVKVLDPKTLTAYGSLNMETDYAI